MGGVRRRMGRGMLGSLWFEERSEVGVMGMR